MNKSNGEFALDNYVITLKNSNTNSSHIINNDFINIIKPSLESPTKPPPPIILPKP
jgi:hypothetical protein